MILFYLFLNRSTEKNKCQQISLRVYNFSINDIGLIQKSFNNNIFIFYKIKNTNIVSKL